MSAIGRKASGHWSYREGRCLRNVVTVAALLGALAAWVPRCFVAVRLAATGGPRLAPLVTGGRTKERLPATRTTVRSTGRVEVRGDSLQPLEGYVLVKVDDVQEVTRGGVFRGKVAERQRQGVVVAVGSGDGHSRSSTEQSLVSVRAGATILYSARAAISDTLLIYAGSEHEMIHEEDIILCYDGGDEPSLESLVMPRGRLLLKLLEVPGQTGVGLLLAQGGGAGRRSAAVGEVLAVGEGLIAADGEVVPPHVEIGEMVLFRQGGEVPLDIGIGEAVDSDLASVKTSDCVAKWRGPNAEQKPTGVV